MGGLDAKVSHVYEDFSMYESETIILIYFTLSMCSQIFIQRSRYHCQVFSGLVAKKLGGRNLKRSDSDKRKDEFHNNSTRNT